MRHAFTTRIGGVSKGPFSCLNLGNPQSMSLSDPQDSAENLDANHRLVQEAIDCSGHRRRWGRQVHGNNVEVVNDRFEDGTDADGLITANSNDLLVIRVADCVPVLLASSDGKVVAAVHAGWRGVIAAVVPSAVRQLLALAEISTSDVRVAIGPCIGFGNFEVGPEVWKLFETQFGASVVKRSSVGRSDANDKGFVDLRSAISHQLERVGVARNNIDTTDQCTFGGSDEFFSHRRDHGITGRMAAMISPGSEAI